MKYIWEESDMLVGRVVIRYGEKVMIGYIAKTPCYALVCLTNGDVSFPYSTSELVSIFNKSETIPL